MVLGSLQEQPHVCRAAISSAKVVLRTKQPLSAELVQGQGKSLLVKNDKSLLVYAVIHLVARFRWQKLV